MFLWPVSCYFTYNLVLHVSSQHSCLHTCGHQRALQCRITEAGASAFSPNESKFINKWFIFQWKVCLSGWLCCSSPSLSDLLQTESCSASQVFVVTDMEIFLSVTMAARERKSCFLILCLPKKDKNRVVADSSPLHRRSACVWLRLH